MGVIGYALCKALGIDTKKKMPEKQVIKALFQDRYTDNPVKDRMLGKIYGLGGKLLVDPMILSTQEIKAELIRTLRVRGLPTDQKSLTIIIRGQPVDPLDKLTFAIFGWY
jgi:hypothetical protein